MKTCKEVLRRQTTVCVRASLVKPPLGQLFGLSYMCSRDKLWPDISETISVSVLHYLGVIDSIRSEYFAVDKIINKFHKVFLLFTQMIKIYFHCWYWWCVRMYQVSCTMSRYHPEPFTKPLDTILLIFYSLLCLFLSLFFSAKFLFSESG